jgi:hypothetical protein
VFLSTAKRWQYKAAAFTNYTDFILSICKLRLHASLLAAYRRSSTQVTFNSGVRVTSWNLSTEIPHIFFADFLISLPCFILFLSLISQRFMGLPCWLYCISCDTVLQARHQGHAKIQPNSKSADACYTNNTKMSVIAVTRMIQ